MLLVLHKLLSFHLRGKVTCLLMMTGPAGEVARTITVCSDSREVSDAREVKSHRMLRPVRLCTQVIVYFTSGQSEMFYRFDAGRLHRAAVNRLTGTTVLVLRDNWIFVEAGFHQNSQNRASFIARQGDGKKCVCVCVPRGERINKAGS